MGCSLSNYDLFNNLVDFSRSVLQPSSQAISTLRYMTSPVICLLSLRRYKHSNTHTYTPSRRYTGRHTRPFRQSTVTHTLRSAVIGRFRLADLIIGAPLQSMLVYWQDPPYGLCIGNKSLQVSLVKICAHHLLGNEAMPVSAALNGNR